MRAEPTAASPTSGRLEPLAPADAVDWYLDDREDELSAESLRTQRSSLKQFRRWAATEGIDDLNSLTGRDLQRFKTWRKREGDLTTVSLNGQLATLRVFMRFCERVNAVEPGLPERVPLPKVPDDQEVSDSVPSDATVSAVREYCATYEYASRRHVALEFMTEIGLRMGAIRSIDLNDINHDERRIHLRHRPGDEERGTPLKNGMAGERVVNISADLLELIETYAEPQGDRSRVTGEDDREPLLTTGAGRVTLVTMRRNLYKLTRPCVYSGVCPHDRDMATCEAASAGQASKCPSSYSPQPFRRWSIMSQLDQGVPKELLSDRVDVSVPVLDKHYDQRSSHRKSERRRAVLAERLDSYDEAVQVGVRSN